MFGNMYVWNQRELSLKYMICTFRDRLSFDSLLICFYVLLFSHCGTDCTTIDTVLLVLAK